MYDNLEPGIYTAGEIRAKLVGQTNPGSCLYNKYAEKHIPCNVLLDNYEVGTDGKIIWAAIKYYEGNGKFSCPVRVFHPKLEEWEKEGNNKSYSPFEDDMEYHLSIAGDNGEK